MTYTVLISARAQRELRDLPNEIIRRIDPVIARLADNPRPSGCRKLKAKTPEAWRIRLGDHRVLYRIDDAAKRVYVLRVGCIYAATAALAGTSRPRLLHYHQAIIPEAENCVTCAAIEFGAE